MVYNGVWISRTENSSLTLRQDHRLVVYEIRMLKRIFGPTWDEVTGELRKLRNEELLYLKSANYC
jgi:hypothetical protein